MCCNFLAKIPIDEGNFCWAVGRRKVEVTSAFQTVASKKKIPEYFQMATGGLWWNHGVTSTRQARHLPPAPTRCAGVQSTSPRVGTTSGNSVRSPSVLLLGLETQMWCPRLRVLSAAGCRPPFVETRPRRPGI